MNVELLEKVKQHILENPESLDMHRWSCETTACISGWAVRLSERENVSMVDGEIPLGLDDDEACRLFYLSGWPSRLRRRYDNAKTPRTRSKVAAQRIDHFIKTGGVE